MSEMSIETMAEGRETGIEFDKLELFSWIGQLEWEV